MADPESYEVYALCYAVRSNRKKHENFIISGWTDPEHDHDQPIAYYIWALRNAHRTIVVDTGFDRAEWTRRTDESNGTWACDYCLLYTSPSPRDRSVPRMPSSA